MPTYKIKEQSKEKTTLSKSDFELDFTVESINEHLKYLVNKKKELTAQMDLEKAKMTNYVENHPYIFNHTPEERNAIALYDRAETLYKVCEEGLESVNKQFAEYAVELDEIKKQTGIEIKID